jgi:hypothetical protein
MTPAPEILPALKDITPSIVLRDEVWKDYYHRKTNRICSRCGDYNKYEIEGTSQPIERELGEKYSCNFYIMNYKINTTRILTNNSLEESAWGSICHKCSDHVLGRAYYPLDSSLEDAEHEMQDMKQNEHDRQRKQEDEIKNLRKQFNKERRENGGRLTSHPTSLHAE